MLPKKQTREQKVIDDQPTYHVPVLLSEAVDALNIKPDGIYVDCTFGGGGHSKEILRKLGNNGRLIAFDQDADAKKTIYLLIHASCLFHTISDIFQNFCVCTTSVSWMEFLLI